MLFQKKRIQMGFNSQFLDCWCRLSQWGMNALMERLTRIIMVTSTRARWVTRLKLWDILEEWGWGDDLPEILRYPINILGYWFFFSTRSQVSN
jgi:hypothetical protein